MCQYKILILWVSQWIILQLTELKLLKKTGKSMKFVKKKLKYVVDWVDIALHNVSYLEKTKMLIAQLRH